MNGSGNKKARKKPVEIEFMQFNNIENAYDISQWAVGKLNIRCHVSLT